MSSNSRNPPRLSTHHNPFFSSSSSKTNPQQRRIPSAAFLLEQQQQILIEQQRNEYLKQANNNATIQTQKEIIDVRRQLNSFMEQELAAASSFDVENMNYEQLNELCDKVGTVKIGVSREIFDRIPTRTLFHQDSMNSHSNNSKKIEATKSSSPPAEVVAGGNKIGISRQQELASQLQLMTKTPPIDGSAAIREQRIMMNSNNNNHMKHFSANNNDNNANNSSHVNDNNYNNSKNNKPNTFSKSNKQLLSEACCICMTDLLDVAANEKSSRVKTLPCKHTFHANCIKQWLESHKTCPVCKADVSTQAASVGALFCQLMKK